MHSILAGYHYLFVDFLQRCQGELDAGIIMDTSHKMGSRGERFFYGDLYGKGACGTNRLRDARLVLAVQWEM